MVSGSRRSNEDRPNAPQFPEAPAKSVEKNQPERRDAVRRDGARESIWQRAPVTVTLAGGGIVYEVLSNTLSAVPGAVWGVVGGLLMLPELWNETKTWREKRKKP